jgi:voltage-gated potassium channel Kch
MIGRTSRARARIGIALRQNRLALACVAAWVAANALVFRAAGLEWGGALLTAACVARGEGTWARFYAGFTEVVVFGAVASLVLANVTRRWRPEATGAELARRASDHVLVVGYSHLGQRVRELAAEAGVDVVVVERDRAIVDALIRTEQPLVVGSAADEGVLEAAGAARAAVVVVATDDLEEAAVACRVVRTANPRCDLVVRCADEDVGKALARAYGARPISTSRIAAAFVSGRAQRSGARSAIVVGRNAVAARAAEALASRGVAVLAVDGEAALVAAPLDRTELVVLADDDLGKNLVYADRVRDVNGSAEIVARIFHESAGQILAHAPFRCTLFSTSRLGAQALVQAGLLRRLSDRDAKAARVEAAAA